MIEEQPQITLFEPNDITTLYIWVFENVKPYIQGRSLEIGSGHGDFSSFLTEGNIPIHLSDPHKENRQMLREKFIDIKYMRAAHNIDINQRTFEFPKLINVFDTIFAVNVLDYGYLSKDALSNLPQLLKYNGHLAIIIPAFTSLYFGLETSLDSWKIVNQKSVDKYLGKQFEVLKTRFLNLQFDLEQNINQKLGLSILAVYRKIS